MCCMGLQRVGHNWATELNWLNEKEKEKKWTVFGLSYATYFIYVIILILIIIVIIIISILQIRQPRLGEVRQFPSGTHWTEEPGGLQSIGSHGVGHDWNNLACMHTLIYLVTTLCKTPFKILGKQYWTKQSQKLHSRKVDRQYTVM